jgi:hypothetical protein
MLMSGLENIKQLQKLYQVVENACRVNHTSSFSKKPTVRE